MNGISVIVPVFNGAHLLPSCVQCIQRARRRVGEIILVDDGSTDETYSRALALTESDERVRVIHTDNHGTYEARRTGVAAASCPYIAFADADDRFCAGALDLLAELLEGHGADISFGGILTVFAPDSPAPPAVCGEVRALSPTEMWPRLMRWGTQEFNLYVWNKLYKRELLENLIEADGVCQGEDVLLSCQAFLRAGRIVETTAPVYCYFQNPDSMLHQGFGDRDLDLIRVWDSVVGLMPEGKLRDMARFNRRRTDFTLICRLILADDPALDARYAQELAQWRADFAAHWRALVSAKALPASRVLLMTALRFAYGPTSALMRCGKRGEKKIWGK